MITKNKKAFSDYKSPERVYWAKTISSSIARGTWSYVGRCTRVHTNEIFHNGRLAGSIVPVAAINPEATSGCSREHEQFTVPPKLISLVRHRRFVENALWPFSLLRIADWKPHFLLLPFEFGSTFRSMVHDIGDACFF